MGPGNLVTRDIMSLQHTQQVRGTQLQKKVSKVMLSTPYLCSFIKYHQWKEIMLLLCLYFNSVGCQCVLITMCCMPMFELNVSRYVT